MADFAQRQGAAADPADMLLFTSGARDAMDIHGTTTWHTSPAAATSAAPCDAPRPARPPARTSFADTVDALPAPADGARPEQGAAAPLRRHVDDMRARERALDDLLGDGTLRTSDPGEILRLQAAVYRHAQQVDVATKVVDRATGTVRQMLMIQV